MPDPVGESHGGFFTLILTGEVKDLANFDIKFWTKFLYIGFFKNLPVPVEK